MPFAPSLEPWANDTPADDQHAANPPGRRGVAFGRLVQCTVFTKTQGQRQRVRQGQADQRREQQCITDLDRLLNHAAGAVTPVQPGVGHADTDDRADQGVG